MSAAPHVPVLLAECLEALAPRAGGLYCDCTLGRGGHAEALLEASHPDGRLIGLDRDPSALQACRERLARFGDRVTLVHARFGEVRGELDRLGIDGVDGLLADLGVSSPQLDEAERGFSFRFDGPLDMRMDPTRGHSAKEAIEALDERALADVIYELGEEKKSRPIARAIKRAESEGKLSSTGELRSAVVSAIGHKPGSPIDPSTRTFQALRLYVNDELGELDRLLSALPSILRPDGVAAIISFHSLEDRAVKYTFRGEATLAPLTKRPVEAGDAERDANPRSRSAKLRAARRIEPTAKGSR
jgi:16S rRNA (cytosine1402-N4)-methyltransferase